MLLIIFICLSAQVFSQYNNDDTYKKSSDKTKVIIFTIGCIIVLLIVVFLLICTYCKVRTRNRNVVVINDVIRFDIDNYIEETENLEHNICIICNADDNESTNTLEITTLYTFKKSKYCKCKIYFHKFCMNKWLMEKPECPLCRKLIINNIN